MGSAVPRSFATGWLLVGVLAVAGLSGWLIWKRPVDDRSAKNGKNGDAMATLPEDVDPEIESSNDYSKISVTTVHPTVGSIERVLIQPGSVHAYEVVQMYAKASGFLRTQHVDIGDRVKKGQILAIVDVPELETSVMRAKSLVVQAKARVEQMKARVKSAEADHLATLAMITQTEAAAKSASAWTKFRAKQVERYKELFATRSIDERLVDETMEKLEAATEAERAAVAAIALAKAQAAAKVAKVHEMQADVVETDAGVDVAQADLARLQVQVQFATLAAPFDGVITQRNLSPGDYVRAANEGSSQALLTIQRVDRMRVIVQIPDRDAVFANKGDPATVQMDALPGQEFEAKISRVSDTEDPQTRLMQAELDLPNPDGKFRQGMYGRVRIVLDKSPDNQLALPSGCLVGKTQSGDATVFVVRDGKACLAKIRIGVDDGLRVAVVEGVSRDDEIVLRPPASLVDHSLVEATSK